jgi:peptide-methionine (S)-S-oxide reductase
MPWEITTNWPEGWATTRFSGHVTTDDIIEAREALAADPGRVPGVRMVMDFEQVTEFDVTPAQIRRLAALWADDPSRPADESWRLGLVASTPVQYGLFRMFEQLRTAVPDQVRVFEDRAGALAWAGIDETGIRETPARETATLGGGCFWCLEAVFDGVDGVLLVQSGYAGGHAPNPSYRQVCAGGTGHAEVVQVVFDPARISYEEILRIFFTIHDPTTPNRQGADVGHHYRSIILFHTPTQQEAARRVMAALEEEGIWSAPLVTEVVPLEAFHPAEAEHDRYFERNPGAAYCRFVVEPKVARARAAFAHRFRS